MGCDIHFFVEHRKPGTHKWVADEYHKKYYWASTDKETGKIKEVHTEEEPSVSELGDGTREIEFNGQKYNISTMDDYNVDNIRIGRNYFLFELLAGVRGSHNQMYDRRGFPEDASDLVTEEFERWDIDAHSPSYLTMHEFFRVIKEWERVNLVEARAEKTDTKWVKARFKDVIKYLKSQNKKYGYHCDEKLFDMPADTRVVFWFDN